MPGSLQLVEDPEQQFAIRIDSASTPDQLSRLLDAVRDSGARRIILVTGCPGSHDLRDRDLRPRIGEMAHYKVGLWGAQRCVCVATGTQPGDWDVWLRFDVMAHCKIGLWGAQRRLALP